MVKQKSKPERPEPAHLAAVTRLELGLVGAALIAGVLLRCLFLAMTSVEHFDEGVYATQLPPQGGYPFRHLYAPDLLPALLHVSIKLVGPGHLGTMAVNLLAGSATILLIWWVGRSWFGPPSGILSATLAAFSDFHILYSRTALTDPLLGFWMLAAVYFIWEAFRRHSFAWSMLAAAAAALAWWTKYNGWLPLAVGLAGISAWIVFNRPPRQRAFKGTEIWIFIAGTTFIFWSPLLYSLSDVGGYAAVQENHRGYFVGFSGWIQSALRQWGALRHLDGWPGLVSLTATSMALLAVTCRDKTSFFRDHPRIRIAFTVACAAALVSCITLKTSIAALMILSGTSLLIAVWYGVSMFTRRQDPDLNPRERDIALAIWLAAAWYCGMIVAIPLYRAYPRLLMPWLISAWLLAGCTVGLRAKSAAPSEAVPVGESLYGVKWLAGLWSIAVPVLALLLFATGVPDRGVPGWQSRTGIELIAGEISSLVGDSNDGSNSRAIYHVFGEPALVYHLRAAGEMAFPVASLSGISSTGGANSNVQSYFIAGPHAERSNLLRDEFSPPGPDLELVKSFDYNPSDLVLLNEFSADQIEAPDFKRTQAIRLYRVK